jgi:hypothetical protein
VNNWLAYKIARFRPGYRLAVAGVILSVLIGFDAIWVICNSPGWRWSLGAGGVLLACIGVGGMSYRNSKKGGEQHGAK